MALNAFVLVLVSCMCYVSAQRYYVKGREECVKETAMRQKIDKWCENEPNEDVEAIRQFFTEDATFVFSKDQSMKINQDNIKMMIEFKRAYNEYFNIKKCNDYSSAPEYLGCEHHTVPSIMKGDVKLVSKDKKHKIKGSYSMEFVYDGGELKVSKFVSKIPLGKDVLHELLKKIHSKGYMTTKAEENFETTTELFEYNDESLPDPDEHVYSDEPLPDPDTHEYSDEPLPDSDAHEYNDEPLADPDAHEYNDKPLPDPDAHVYSDEELPSEDSHEYSDESLETKS